MGSWSGLPSIIGVVLLGVWLAAVVYTSVRLARRLVVAPRAAHRRLVTRWGMVVGALTSAWLWLFGGGLGELQRALRGDVGLGSALITGSVLVLAGVVSGCMFALIVLKKYEGAGS